MAVALEKIGLELMNMTGSNLTKLIVIERQASRLIPEILMAIVVKQVKCDLAEMMAFTTFRDFFLHLQTYLGRKLCFRVRVFELKPVSAKY
jgi:hypothetical protein